MTFKEKFKKTFSYTWHFYVIAIVLPCISFPLAYSFMHRPMEYEKLSLFISSNVGNPNGLKSKLLEQFTNKGVKTIEISSYDAFSNEYMYAQKLSVVGFNKCDVLLIPNSKLSIFNPLGSMIDFNNDIKTFCNSSDETYYSYEGFDYGLKINNNSFISNYVSLKNDEDYYLFLGGKSWNVGNYSSKNPSTTNAFDLVKFLIGK